MRNMAGFPVAGAVAGLLVLYGCAQTAEEQSKLSASEVGSRLSASEVESLLLFNTEIGTLNLPSRSVVEGNSGQTYEAYYQDKNRVWYALDKHKIELWFWTITEDGVLCRGPSFDENWCRAIAPDGAGGYKAVGFRTGKIRYQFRVEKGLSSFPKHFQFLQK